MPGIENRRGSGFLGWLTTSTRNEFCHCSSQTQNITDKTPGRNAFTRQLSDRVRSWLYKSDVCLRRGCERHPGNSDTCIPGGFPDVTRQVIFAYSQTHGITAMTQKRLSSSKMHRDSAVPVSSRRWTFLGHSHPINRCFVGYGPFRGRTHKTTIYTVVHFM